MSTSGHDGKAIQWGSYGRAHSDQQQVTWPPGRRTLEQRTRRLSDAQGSGARRSVTRALRHVTISPVRLVSGLLGLSVLGLGGPSRYTQGTTAKTIAETAILGQDRQLTDCHAGWNPPGPTGPRAAARRRRSRRGCARGGGVLPPHRTWRGPPPRPRLGEGGQRPGQPLKRLPLTAPHTATLHVHLRLCSKRLRPQQSGLSSREAGSGWPGARYGWMEIEI